MRSRFDSLKDAPIFFPLRLCVLIVRFRKIAIYSLYAFSYVKLFFFFYDFSLPNGESRAINVASDFSKVSHVLAADFAERSLVPETKGQESNRI